jgi:hypothetical protein
MPAVAPTRRRPERPARGAGTHGQTYTHIRRPGQSQRWARSRTLAVVGACVFPAAAHDRVHSVAYLSATPNKYLCRIPSVLPSPWSRAATWPRGAAAPPAARVRKCKSRRSPRSARGDGRDARGAARARAAGARRAPAEGRARGAGRRGRVGLGGARCGPRKPLPRSEIDYRTTCVPPFFQIHTVERIVRMSHVPHRWQVACVACGGARGAPRTHDGGAPRERRAVSLLHYPLLARGLHCPLKRSAAYPRVRYTPYP